MKKCPNHGKKLSMNILIPTRKNEKIKSEVKKGIKNQTIFCKIFTYADSENYNHKREHEAANRNYLKRYASYPYTVYMDSDVVMTNEKTIENMQEYLNNHETDAVAINTKPKILDSEHLIKRREQNKHIVESLFMIRTKLLETFKWTYQKDQCLCKQLNNNFKIRYLRTIQAREILK